MNWTSINIQQQAGRTGLRCLAGVGVVLLIGLAFAGCATHGVFQSSGAARLSNDGKDCIWVDSIYDWKALTDQSLIIWSPNSHCAYRVDFARQCHGLRITEEIAFQYRQGRICPDSGDTIIVPVPGSDCERCRISAIKRLTTAELQQLLPNVAVPEQDASTDKANCTSWPTMGY